MTANESINPVSTRPGKHSLRALAYSLLGAVAGFSAISLMTRLHVPVKTLGWSNIMALMLGLTFLLTGVLTVALSANRKQVAESFASEDKEMSATNEEVRSFRLQGLTLLLAGAMLLAPVVALGAPAQSASLRIAVFVFIALCFAVQTAINIRIWIDGDEFMRAMILQLSTITFWIVQGALFLWAAAEHLHLAPALSSWAIANILLAVYLAVSIAIGLRLRR